MTHNQIDYLGLEETKRNNLVLSEEQGRHNRATEAETKRNNLFMNDETKRNNLYNNKMTRLNLRETKRSNKSVQKETKRHNLVTEKEQTRSNKAKEAGTIYSANMSSSASRYVADRNAASNYTVQLLRNVAQAKTNRSNEAIAKMRNSTDMAMKSIDKLIADKRLKQSDRESLRKIKNDMVLAKKRMKNDMSIAELNNLTKKVTSWQGMIYELGGLTSKDNLRKGVQAISRSNKGAPMDLSKQSKSQSLAKQSQSTKKKKQQERALKNASGGSLQKPRSGNYITRTDAKGRKRYVSVPSTKEQRRKQSAKRVQATKYYKY